MKLKVFMLIWGQREYIILCVLHKCWLYYVIGDPKYDILAINVAQNTAMKLGRKIVVDQHSKIESAKNMIFTKSKNLKLLQILYWGLK